MHFFPNQNSVLYFSGKLKSESSIGQGMDGNNFSDSKCAKTLVLWLKLPFTCSAIKMANQMKDHMDTGSTN